MGAQSREPSFGWKRTDAVFFWVPRRTCDEGLKWLSRGYVITEVVRPSSGFLWVLNLLGYNFPVNEVSYWVHSDYGAHDWMSPRELNRMVL